MANSKALHLHILEVQLPSEVSNTKQPWRNEGSHTEGSHTDHHLTDYLAPEKMTLDRLEKVSRAGALLVLVATAVLNLQAGRSLLTSSMPTSSPAAGKTSKDVLICANATSATLCIVAALAYADMHMSFTGLMQNDVRSLDWLVTCPLLVIEMAVLLGARPGDATVLIAATASLFMILSGWNAHQNPFALMIGFVFLGMVAGLLFTLNKKYKWCERDRVVYQRVVWWAFALWPLYGLVACLGLLCAVRIEATQCAYNVLDIFSKGAFGLVIAFLAF